MMLFPGLPLLRQAVLAGVLGLSLLLPATAPVLADGEGTVHVAKGDTLSSIALTHYGDAAYAQAIAAYNHLKSADRIYAGQILELPPRSRATAEPPASPPSVMEGVATWYGPGFEGKTTKCGQVYNQWGRTAASNDFPCGTIVEVTDLRNNRRVTVPVTDTGAFRHPNVADLSRGAFSLLDATRIGVIPVRVVLRSLPHAAAGQKR